MCFHYLSLDTQRFLLIYTKCINKGYIIHYMDRFGYYMDTIIHWYPGFIILLWHFWDIYHYLSLYSTKYLRKTFTTEIYHQIFLPTERHYHTLSHILPDILMATRRETGVVGGPGEEEDLLHLSYTQLHSYSWFSTSRIYHTPHRYIQNNWYFF